MIFQLVKVSGGIDRIYETPLVFFENAQISISCDENLFPNWFRPVYLKCPGVKNHFDILFLAFKKLSKKKQRQLIDIYRNSRDIEKICSDETILYPNISTLDKSIHVALKNLFKFLFDETIGTAIFKKQSKMQIKDHYVEFQKKNNVHVCPFCGLETYPLPQFRRAEYDHFLPISKYPWLGVNLNNLVPMGDHCNGKKNDTNVLYTDSTETTRRKVWYPYEWVNHSIELKCTDKPTVDKRNGTWSVKIKAASPKHQNKINTWDEVFEISSRFEDSIASYHRSFIDDFARKNSLKGTRLTTSKLITELKKYRNNGIGNVKIETMAKLKFIWSNYYINCTDKSQLAVIVNAIAHPRKINRP